MLSVIIPTKDNEIPLAYCLSALVSGAAEGVVREVVVVDGGSSDGTEKVADAAGCTLVRHRGSRGEKMREGVRACRRGNWLLFLRPDAVLSADWHHEAAAFIEKLERAGQADRMTGVFSFSVDDFGFKARVRELFVASRARLLRLPYGEQGLLVSRRHYERLGGHRDLQDHEDIDLFRRIGSARIRHLRSKAVVSSQNIREAVGPVSAFKKAVFVALCVLRVPTRMLVRPGS